VSGPRRGIPFVVAAPSGTGKTTVCRRVVEEEDLVDFSVSHTTRARRAGESDGLDYHFVSREEFQRMVDTGAFLEWAEYNGNLYGTSWKAIEEPLERGRDVLLEIEVQGAAQVRERRADARFVFLLPPSLAVLEQRLSARGTDDPAEVARRLALTERELAAAERFDYAVVNDDLARCVADVRAILRGEREGRSEELRRRFEPGRALARLRRPGAA
jgi:guanylate kinase